MYMFYSDGPMGTIRKAVLYERIGKNLFNLGFGDWNGELNQINDFGRSNNGDRDKVLATVAFTALDFTDQFPDAHILFEGTTLARTRLYQMSIAYNLLEISTYFQIQGLKSESWEPFRLGRNYKAFLVRRI